MSDEPMKPTPDPDPDERDELDAAASASLDGEPVDPAWREHPGFAARIAELARARDALREDGAPPPLDDVTRRRLVRTALDHTAETSERAAAPTPWFPRAGLLGVAAAVLAVVVGVGALVLSRGDDGGGSSATADQEATTLDEDTGGDSGESGDGGATTAPPADLGDLGDVTDLDALGERLAPDAQRTTDDAPAPSAGEEARACTDEVRSAAPGPVVATGTGTYEGRPALVVLGADAAGNPVLVVATIDDCAVQPPRPVG